jgi:uncharacterized protein (UPF0264 family)
MKRLLVSVRDAAEARIALDSGVDLIDVKEPRRGALGAADPAIWREVLALVEGRVPVSCALGELHEAQAVANDIPAGMSFLKVGLARVGSLVDWPKRWADVLESQPPGCHVAAVVYADWRSAGAPAPEAILEQAVLLSCSALLVDTFDKRAGTVFDHWPASDLAVFLGAASQARLTTLLGGGLTWSAMETARATPADYLAVRGLACAGDRSSSIDARACRRLVENLKGGASPRTYNTWVAGIARERPQPLRDCNSPNGAADNSQGREPLE